MSHLTITVDTDALGSHVEVVAQAQAGRWRLVARVDGTLRGAYERGVISTDDAARDAIRLAGALGMGRPAPFTVTEESTT